MDFDKILNDVLGQPAETEKNTLKDFDISPQGTLSGYEAQETETGSKYTFSDYADSELKPVKASDKRVIGGDSLMVNQLFPLKYEFGWDFYKKAMRGHWNPNEVNMVGDLPDFYQKLTDVEKHVYTNTLAYLSTADIMAMRNVAIAVMEKTSAPELQMYQAQQVAQECVSPDTELLTPTGWVNVTEVTYDTEIAQWSPNGQIDFVKPIALSKTMVDKYYHVYNKQNHFNQLVTENHRMVYFNAVNGNLIVKNPNTCSISSGSKYIVSGIKTSGTQTLLTPYERFLIALQADGSILYSNARNGNMSNTIACAFGFKKKRKIQRLIEILKDCGLEYTLSDVNKKGMRRFYVKVPKDAIVTKDFGDWVNLSDKTAYWCDDFLMELGYWDGTFSKGCLNRIKYATINKNNADIVQALAAMCDAKTHYYVYVDNRKETYNNIYEVSILKGVRFIQGDCLKKKVLPGGSAYGIQVPSTFLLIRRNGAVSITGNSIHTEAYQLCIENLRLPQEEIYNRYRVVPAIRDKVKYAAKMIEAAVEADTDFTKKENVERFLLSYIYFAAIFEGTIFITNFAPILSLGRRNLMKGTVEQLTWIMTEEVSHCAFGIRVCREIMKEENVTPDPEKLMEMVKESERLERQFIDYILKDPILGYTKEEHMGMFKHLINRRWRQLGFEQPYDVSETIPLRWLDEMAGGIKKDVMFFERGSANYQTGGLSWD